MFGEFTHKKLDLDGEMGYNLRMKPTKDPRAKCDECKHRSVSLCPGTQRQIIARYKAAWDACYACARAALSDKANLERLIVAYVTHIESPMRRSTWITKPAQRLYAKAARIAKRKAGK